MADHFEAFGIWLGLGVGVKKAAITLNRYLPFFMEIETRWGEIPFYEDLVGRFGVAGLRRRLLPLRWLTSARIVAVDETAKKDASARARIAKTLARLPTGTPGRAILDAYHDALLSRHAAGKTSLSAAALALAPAAALLAKASSTSAARLVR